MQQPYWGPYVGQVIKYEIRSVLTEIPCKLNSKLYSNFFIENIKKGFLA